jgi:hypothetical protein
MIVVEDQDRLTLVTQEDHAWLTGDLAASLPVPVPHRAAFVAAARVHDNGWRETDAAPTVDEDGRPHGFNNVPDPIYEELWRRGIERAAAVDPLVGLLVGLHGARFFESRESEGMRRLVDEERARQDGVLQDLGLGGSWDALPERVAEVSDWIAMLDALSLLLCGAHLPDRITPRVAGIEYTLSRAGAEVSVDPWPFEDVPLHLSVRTRSVAAGPYADGEQLRARLAAAQSHQAPVSVVRQR